MQNEECIVDRETNLDRVSCVIGQDDDQDTNKV